TYQWLRDGQAIEGATGERYTLTQADVGKGLTVRASYVDQFGHAESRTSAATAAVDNANDAPTGGVALSGTAAIGQVLHARSSVADADGMGTPTVTWWSSADGKTWVLIERATGESFVITADLADRMVRAQVSYVDGQGTKEVVVSDATAKVPPIPVPPPQTPPVSVNPPAPPALPVVPPAPPAPADAGDNTRFLPSNSPLSLPSLSTITVGEPMNVGNPGANLLPQQPGPQG
ncbi:hypothetical protein, partial [Azohydromonas lata]|uniref:hypothetical protein n=1 Tax=Azohydromonas lata TaxID=45677 RepID=UPI001C3F2987